LSDTNNMALTRTGLHVLLFFLTGVWKYFMINVSTFIIIFF